MSTNNFLLQSLRARGLVQEDGTVKTEGASISPLPASTEAGEGQPAGPTTTTVVEVPEPEENDEISVIEAPEEADEVAEDAAVDAGQDEEEEEDHAIDQMFNRLDMLQTSAVAINQFGLNPAAVAIGQATGLLSNTALYTMGCESFGLDAEVEKQMGLESLASAGEEVAEKLGAKLFSRVGGWADKLVEVVSHAGEKISALNFKAVGEAAKTAAGKVGTTFGRRAAGAAEEAGAAAGKARGGVKTALLIAAAAASVGAVIAVATRSLPKDATEAATKGWFGKIRQAVAGIKWPFGKLELRPDAEATGVRGMLGKLFCGGKPAKSAEASASGFIGKAGAWTKEAFESVKSAVARAITSVIEAIRSAGKVFVDAVKGGANVVDHGAKGANIGARVGAVREGASLAGSKTIGLLSRGTYFAGVAAVLAMISGLIYFVVVGGVRLIKKAFGSAAA